jgi:hypothetical protein
MEVAAGAKYPVPATPAAAPPAPCFFEEVWRAAPATPDGDKPPFQWTPWLSDTSVLAAFDFQAAMPVPRDPQAPFADPVVLPNATGVACFWCQTTKGISRCWNASRRGSAPASWARCRAVTTMPLAASGSAYPLPGTALLELTNVYGGMGARRGVMGSAMTYLQVYDLA